MTIAYAPILAALKADNMLKLRRQLEALDLLDLQEAGTFSG